MKLSNALSCECEKSRSIIHFAQTLECFRVQKFQCIFLVLTINFFRPQLLLSNIFKIICTFVIF